MEIVQERRKKRPISCYYGHILNEDIPELKILLEKYKEGNDNEFADYLADMIEKKIIEKVNMII